MDKAANERLVERVVILAEDMRRVQIARDQVSAYMDQSAHPLEVTSVPSVEQCLHLMDRYINLIVLNYAGLPKERAVPAIERIRAVYGGRVLLINEDASITSCEWGRRHKVDEHIRSADQLKTTLPRLAPAIRKSTREVLWRCRL